MQTYLALTCILAVLSLVLQPGDAFIPNRHLKRLVRSAGRCTDSSCTVEYCGKIITSHVSTPSCEGGRCMCYFNSLDRLDPPTA
uniref:Uncharacterized protein n=1 Tax=Ditylenchus dipsaci TaxID=166011 RepID=A0A915CNJ8_9BILA